MEKKDRFLLSKQDTILLFRTLDVILKVWVFAVQAQRQFKSLKTDAGRN